LAIICANFYDHPSASLKLMGVTGTNGKTTTVTLLHAMFRQLGYKTGMLSTVRNIVNDLEIPATHTTPDPLQLNALLAKMVEAGCTHCFMEVSSHAVVQHRVSGLQFAGARCLPTSPAITSIIIKHSTSISERRKDSLISFLPMHLHW
jgi:UDP-N-acetylmuramoyl-L-alanyl-D-glutamate--2,6-diaminopimelate ligase